MRNTILLIMLIMSVMLFTGNPFDGHARLYQAIWNTGHLFFFALLTWFLLTHFTLNKLSALRMLLLSLLFSFLLGALIEALQYLVGRSMEWQDVLMDMLGAFLGFLMVQLSLQKTHQVIEKLFVIVLSFSVILLAFYPVFNVIRDDEKIESNMPVVASFESQADLSRWENNLVSVFDVDRKLYSQGDSSALIKFDSGMYPDISLIELYPNWASYNFLNMSVYNDQSEQLKINVKIYDALHRKRGKKYSDRFNVTYTLNPGWNALRIKLLDVYHAPKSRRMDLTNIAGLALFLHDTKSSRTIHLDNIYLSK